MKNLRVLLLIGCLAYLGACLSPKAKAGDWDEKTVISFGQPVEIPGIVLPAGAYVFSFLGSTADRDLIEVLSQDQQKLYATIAAIPDYRANASVETSIVFEERKAGAPRAIKEWFFPNPRYGHVFVYAKTGVLELGKSDKPEDVTVEDSGQTMLPEETDYLRVLHQKQTHLLELAKADESESANKPGELTYMQVLHLKQSEEPPQGQIAARPTMVK